MFNNYEKIARIHNIEKNSFNQIENGNGEVLKRQQLDQKAK